ncbi:MAG: molybdopterin-guanine dinucleotide biosynthesis protein B [Coriobacteriia bacterium]|nr:molybdopterin-guanine dinucleotide biosynthesis protein B [Coriobacteriia bacterium]
MKRSTWDEPAPKGAQAKLRHNSHIAVPHPATAGHNLRLPSPPLAFVGRKNSGKTTLLVKLIAELTARGLDVATCKHHGHPDFDIDVPGKDSWRHRQAGACATAVLSDRRFALIEDLNRPRTCADVLELLSNHDIVLIEGFRDEGLPYVEVLRQDNDRDLQAAPAFCQLVLSASQSARPADKNREELPTAAVTDIPEVIDACAAASLPCFHPDDVIRLADYVQQRHARPLLSVAIQAGGESRRMGQSKALVPFLGRPLIVRLLERLNPIADELIVTTNEPERLAFLLDDYPNLKLVTDTYKERGALPGLATALKAASFDHVALVACDMVNASPELLSAESNLLRKGDYQLVIPRTRHGIEPFAAVYERNSCLAAALAALEAGEKRIRAVVSSLDALVVDKGSRPDVPFPLGCFLNVNTPEELAFAERAVQD